MAEQAIKGACYCGAVSYEVRGKPLVSAYCHCTLCQRLNGTPIVHSLHFSKSAFTWTYDKNLNLDDIVYTYAVDVKPWKLRYTCKTCGATVVSYNSKADKYSIWAGQLERDSAGNYVDREALKPTGHMFYDTRMLDVEDGLPKWDGYEGVSNRIG